MDDQIPLDRTPKLPLFSFPLNRSSESPGFATPPVNIAGSVPFLWEEAPGKPRASHDSKRKGGVIRCLELPPRLLLSSESCKSSSPTTVLDGPYVIRRRSLSLPLKEKGCLLGKGKEMSEGKFDFSCSMNSRCDFGGIGLEGDEDFMGTKVNISRVRRKGSLFTLSTSKSHLLARVYEGFKQVIPWRRRQERTH